MVNAGKIDANAGDGKDYGGYNNEIWVYGRNGVANTGALSARGGSATNSWATSGTSVYLIADTGSTANTGAIDVTGGSTQGADYAGSGGSVYVNGTTVSNSATIKAQGGSATQSGGYGADGGYVELASSQGTTSNTVAAPTGINIKGGVGDQQNGAYGTVMIDGLSATAAWSF